MGKRHSTRLLDRPALKALRESLGLSQKQLAEACGMSANHLSQLETGRTDGRDGSPLKEPSLPKLKALADRLGVPIEAITYPVAVATSKPQGLVEAAAS